jgi:hypothetical protein
MSETAAPLRSILEKNVEWHWEDQQDKSFQKLKQSVAQAATLKYFDPKKPVKISVDASSKGMGAVLLQAECPIAYASKPLTSSQHNYAQIGKKRRYLGVLSFMNSYSECQKYRLKLTTNP